MTAKLSAADNKFLTAALRRALKRVDDQGIPAYDHVVMALVRNAVIGKENSIRMVFELMEGKITSSGENTLQIGLGEGVTAVEIRAVYPEMQDGRVIKQIEHEKD